TGTGGGISVRLRDRVYIAPTGVQKERIRSEDLFVLDRQRNIVEAPVDEHLRLSACLPLFYNAYDGRDAGAVLHSHSRHAVLATMLTEGDVLRITHLEMLKGLRGKGYHDVVEIPIIENTAHECDLTEAMADAMARHPDVDAVLVRRHGIYVWGSDWRQAKTQAECLDYLCAAAVDMRRLGFDPTVPPPARS
ncbi:MAG: methylthioribulose 1-phosphate dehydratase, partial [Myxococcales bacterium]|nr:methylthioribulose 1-phosphate dehydratase [Myxococcales bacterium]